MKKFTALLLTLVLCLSMVACGSSGPDKQPAIDSYNTLAENYNAFVDIANKDLSAWGEEDIEFMNNCADVINEYGTKLDSDEELTQEEGRQQHQLPQGVPVRHVSVSSRGGFLF